MHHISAAIIVFFIALFAYTKLAGPIPFSVSSIVTTKTDSFTVTGEGKTSAIPDIAVVTVGVTAQGATVKQVQQDINAKTDVILSAVKKIGIDAKDIQTSNYSVHPSYDYESGRNRIAGYQATSTLTIKVRQTELASAVIDAATAGGANEIQGITFEVSDKAKAENEAREKAVTQAKQKADAAAKAGGFTLGRVINYSENFGGDFPRPFYAKTEARDVAAADQPPTQVEPGSSEITVTVSLSYEIR